MYVSALPGNITLTFDNYTYISLNSYSKVSNKIAKSNMGTGPRRHSKPRTQSFNRIYLMALIFIRLSNTRILWPIHTHRPKRQFDRSVQSFVCTADAKVPINALHYT